MPNMATIMANRPRPATIAAAHNTPPQSAPTPSTTSSSAHSSPQSASARSSKTSLGFICSPSSVPVNSLPPLPSVPSPRSVMPGPSASTSATSPSTTTSTSTSTKRLRSRLETLPRDALGLIAFNLVIDERGLGSHPSPLIPFFLTSRSIYEAISFDNNPQLYNKLFRATFDTKALDRRYDWMVKHLATMAGRGRKIFDLFSDPRSWAIDYKTRWGQSWRMRQVARIGKLEIPGICDKDQVAADLWNVWFVLTENDGRNLAFLAEQCHFQQWIQVWYREDMLKDSLVPGYPKETGEKALGIWCSLISGTDFSAEQTPEEVDEKIFVMRPFVFACAKYDITYAPWHHRRLPLCPPSCKDHEPDVTLRSKALPYKRFGYTWRRAPPHFILGCYLVFLRLLERQPERIGLKPGSSTFSFSPGHVSQPGLFSITRILPSIYHDREWQRNSVCQDPHTSPGLPPLTFRGEVEGFWRANFLFYDFDMYRQILAGNMRAVYTGTFAEQAAEMELRETVIRVRAEDVGGNGPMLCAGFREVGENGAEEEQQRIREGYGYEVVNEDDGEKDEQGWTKEILVSGRLRSSWGWASVRGRVRAWDGLVILSISYQNNIAGRWLWRGYLHTGGHLIGRWRDTFTAENLRGYEGAFGMVRAGDVFYPPHFPRRMEDSLGFDQSDDNQATALVPAGGGAAPDQFPIGRPYAVAQAQIRDAQAQAPPSTASNASVGSAASPAHSAAGSNLSRPATGSSEVPTESAAGGGGATVLGRPIDDAGPSRRESLDSRGRADAEGGEPRVRVEKRKRAGSDSISNASGTSRIRESHLRDE